MYRGSLRLTGRLISLRARKGGAEGVEEAGLGVGGVEEAGPEGEGPKTKRRTGIENRSVWSTSGYELQPRTRVEQERAVTARKRLALT